MEKGKSFKEKIPEGLGIIVLFLLYFAFFIFIRGKIPDAEILLSILKDLYGARGTFESPGLMAALDKGLGCEGLLFRIACDNIEEETEILWRREQVGPAYKSAFVEALVPNRRITALTFVADHDAEMIDANLTREEQIHYIDINSL